MSKGKLADDEEILARFLAEIREDAGLTQRDLAVRMGVSQSWVKHREVLYTSMKVVDFVKFCEACGTDPERAFKRFHRSLA